MNKRWCISLLTLMLGLLPGAVFAHTGTGELHGIAAGVVHPLGGMDHLLAMVAVGLWAAQLGGSARWRLPGAFLMMMVPGALLAVSGVAVPHAESGILLSVGFLGLLVAAAFTLPVQGAAALVGFFALFHGYAHGVEMLLSNGVEAPLSNQGGLYGLGFLVGTGLLHGIGLALGAGLQRLSRGPWVRLAGGTVTLAGLYLVAT